MLQPSSRTVLGLLLLGGVCSCRGACSNDEDDGGCNYRDQPATCTLEKVDGWEPKAPTIDVTWRASLPRASCEGRLAVAPADYEAVVAELQLRGGVPCTIEVETDGSCPLYGSCVIQMAAIPGATWAGGARIVPP